MYCKHCGKQIADDSTFCQFCGGRVDSTATPADKEALVPSNDTNNDVNTENGPSKIIISTEEKTPIQVEVSKKEKNNSSTIANEIVGNLKMIGYAFCIFFIYIVVFIVVRSQDAKPLTEEGYWGESCYDPKYITSNHMFYWEQHYAVKVCMAIDHKKYEAYKKKKKGTNATHEDVVFASGFEPISSIEASRIWGMNANEALTYANQVAKEKSLPQELLEEFKTKAMEDAKNDRDSFNQEISIDRKTAYKEDIKKNAIYAAIISLTIMIPGRYIIKVFKWVNTNRTYNSSQSV